MVIPLRKLWFSVCQTVPRVVVSAIRLSATGHLSEELHCSFSYSRGVSVTISNKYETVEGTTWSRKMEACHLE